MFSAVKALNASLFYFYCSSRSKNIFILKPTITLHGYFQRMLKNKSWLPPSTIGMKLRLHGAGIVAFTFDQYIVFDPLLFMMNILCRYCGYGSSTLKY